MKQAALWLEADSLILILIQTEAEASKLWTSISSNGELGRILKLNNIQFGPISNPPLTQMFSLVIYYSMPKKIEQLLAQITLLNNNYIYQNYGKLRKLNVTHFHLMADAEDFTRSRIGVFLKAVSELQAERFVDAILKKTDHLEQTASPPTARISFKELTASTELQPLGINRLLRQLQGDGALKVIQQRPSSFIFKPTVSGQEKEVVQKLMQASEKHNLHYKITALRLSEVFDKQWSEAVQMLKALMVEELIVFETDDEELELTVRDSLKAQANEVVKNAYRSLRSQNILESRLLQYLYLILRIGSTPTEKVFSPSQCNKNMTSLLKNYALAEESSIKNLFPENAVRDVMEPILGDEDQLQESEFAFRQLLYRVEDFFPQELALCSDQEKGPSAREFIRIQMVRSILGLPGSHRPKMKLGSHHSNIDFLKIDFESLLGRSEVALSEYLNKAK